MELSSIPFHNSGY